MKLIGIHGRARSGKDTAADYLVRYHGFERYSFADPLKAGIEVMLDWGSEHTHGDLKDQVDPTYGFSPRHAMQTLGTDWARDCLREDLWLVVADKKLEGKERVVIPDVRFDNEADFIRDKGGVIVHLHRSKIQKVEYHASEEGILMEKEDYFIKNDYSIEELEYSMYGIFENL